MRARGVLKLVDQQMLHPLVQPHEHIWAFQCGMSRDASFGKVDDILFREDDAQLRDGVPQDDEYAAYRAPLLFAVAAGRKLSHSAEQSQKLVVCAQLLQQRCKVGSVMRVVFRRNDASFPPCARFREKQTAQGLPVRGIGETLNSPNLSQSIEFIHS